MGWVSEGVGLFELFELLFIFLLLLFIYFFGKPKITNDAL